ncbi:GGDEF domain-containing protein [Pseudoduganella aquatica]|uniref:GGDEF domain-containing protein n=1 Tax=Pseudoduganella aquatica TaxID=2660641 RepID=UPI001E2D70D2|nr:GGDEF domain-containing protein [Pseudoduganella aquatica]
MPSQRRGSTLPSMLAKLGAMTSIRELQLVEQSLLRTLAPLLGVAETSLYRTNEHHQVTHKLHHYRSDKRGPDGAASTTERIDDIRNDASVAPHISALLDYMRLLKQPSRRTHGQGYLFGYPLIHGGGQQCGYFVFEREQDLTPVEEAVIAGVLKLYTNHYTLLDTSQRDRLTGLRNRYSLELNLDRLWEELAAQQAPGADAPQQAYWLGILDIDHFKRVNDQYGHIIGDEILLLVARLLGRTLRRADLLYRYGGEEFIAVVVAPDLAGATALFERLRLAIEQFTFPQVGRVTISGGFCSATPTLLPGTVLDRADRALYQAKAAGRNRVLHYDALISQGILDEVECGTIELF